jgi:hypothetical protein
MPLKKKDVFLVLGGSPAMHTSETIENRRRMHMYWLMCIPMRICIALVAFWLTSLPDQHGRIVYWLVGGYASITTLGFTYSAIKKNTRGGLGGVIWWSRVRIVHIMVWVVTAALCFHQVRGAGAFLFLDAFLGISVGCAHYCYGAEF